MTASDSAIRFVSWHVFYVSSFCYKSRHYFSSQYSSIMRATTFFVALVSFFCAALAVPVASRPVEAVAVVDVQQSRRGTPASLGSLTSGLLCGSSSDPQLPININAVVSNLLNTLDLTVMSITDELKTLDIVVDLGLGNTLYGVEGVVDEVLAAVNNILSSILGVPVKSTCNKTHSSTDDPVAIDLGLHIMGLTNRDHCSTLNGDLNNVLNGVKAILAAVGLHLNINLQIDGL